MDSPLSLGPQPNLYQAKLTGQQAISNLIPTDLVTSVMHMHHKNPLPISRMNIVVQTSVPVLSSSLQHEYFQLKPLFSFSRARALEVWMAWIAMGKSFNYTIKKRTHRHKNHQKMQLDQPAFFGPAVSFISIERFASSRSTSRILE